MVCSVRLPKAWAVCDIRRTLPQRTNIFSFPTDGQANTLSLVSPWAFFSLSSAMSLEAQKQIRENTLVCFRPCRPPCCVPFPFFMRMSSAYISFLFSFPFFMRMYSEKNILVKPQKTKDLVLHDDTKKHQYFGF
jgi:hypothetical protein